MPLFSLLLFTLGMVGAWCFYVLAVIHIRRFQEYSILVKPALRTLAILLGIITVSGYVLIYNNRTSSVQTKTIAEDESQINY